MLSVLSSSEWLDAQNENFAYFGGDTNHKKRLNPLLLRSNSRNGAGGLKIDQLALTMGIV